MLSSFCLFGGKEEVENILSSRNILMMRLSKWTISIIVIVNILMYSVNGTIYYRQEGEEMFVLCSCVDKDEEACFFL